MPFLKPLPSCRARCCFTHTICLQSVPLAESIPPSCSSRNPCPNPGHRGVPQMCTLVGPAQDFISYPTKSLQPMSLILLCPKPGRWPSWEGKPSDQEENTGRPAARWKWWLTVAHPKFHKQQCSSSKSQLQPRKHTVISGEMCVDPWSEHLYPLRVYCLCKTIICLASVAMTYSNSTALGTPAHATSKSKGSGEDKSGCFSK